MDRFYPSIVKGIISIYWFDLIVGKGLGVYKTMNEFTRHKK
jgi:hypothetical protein